MRDPYRNDMELWAWTIFVCLLAAAVIAGVTW